MTTILIELTKQRRNTAKIIRKKEKMKYIADCRAKVD